MARNRAETKLILVHCSGTRTRQDVGVEELHQRHLNLGVFSEAGPSGYHEVIRRSGLVELGRSPNAVGFGSTPAIDAIAYQMCLVGGARRIRDKHDIPHWDASTADDNFTRDQKKALAVRIEAALLVWPGALVVPHYLLTWRPCPPFDVWAWQMSVFGYSHEQQATEFLANLTEDE